jgi:heme-degrading monooxygenase HmoA
MPTLTEGRIRHGVVFSLTHAEGSPEEADFLRANAELASIPGVEAFELLREVSPNNDYRFALVMEFASREAYDAYSAHPEHVAFVRDRWDAEVSDFLELDSEAL